MYSSLHQAQAHPTLRCWQSQRNDINHPKDFVLPLFIGNDDSSCEPIESMPGVFRYGCNRAIEYLEPLVQKHHLAAVLLFPVVTKQETQGHHHVTNESSDDDADVISSTGSPRSRSSSSVAASSSSSLLAEVDDEIGQQTNVGHRELGSNAPDNDNSNNNNPFLQQSEETENLLEADNQAEEQQRPQQQEQHPPSAQPVGRWIPVAPLAENRTTPRPTTDQVHKVSKAKDVKLIKSMALRDQHNPVLRLIPKLRAKFPDLLIICDVCLCAFTSTGHCCLFEDHARAKSAGSDPTTGQLTQTRFPISNKLSCQYLAMLAVEYGFRGCDVVAPSDMMDDRVHVIGEKLNESGLSRVSVLSYLAKFASSLYGPFRQATDNAPEFGDRRAYQLPPGSRGMSLKAVSRDIRLGADFVMVKPAGLYLDIVRDIKNEHPEVPIAVYHVSSEYSMLMAAANAGSINLEQAVHETFTSFRRAGAAIIITYFTPVILQNLKF